MHWVGFRVVVGVCEDGEPVCPAAMQRPDEFLTTGTIFGIVLTTTFQNTFEGVCYVVALGLLRHRNVLYPEMLSEVMGWRSTMVASLGRRLTIIDPHNPLPIYPNESFSKRVSIIPFSKLHTNYTMVSIKVNCS